MRSIAKSVVTIVLALTVANAEEWKTGTCNGPHIKVIKRYDSDQQVQKDMYRTLSARGKNNFHDIYFDIQSFGDKKAVPLLIERLRLDYSPTEPAKQPPGLPIGIDCVQIHLVEALRSLTNTDQGEDYPRWAKWWEDNRKFSQQRWDLDGFAAIGLHAVAPVGDQFALELIDVLGSKDHDDRDYCRFGARRLIASVQPDKRLEWVSRAAASDQKSRRLGALEVLRSMETAGDESLIRKLTVDADIEMRRGALSILNARLRLSKSVGSSKDTRVACLVESDRSDLSHLKSVSFAGDSLVVAYDDKVTAYDPQTRRKLWSKAIPEMSAQVLVIGEQVVFDTWKGDVFALDGRGNMLWRNDSASGKNTDVQRLLKLGDGVVVVRKRVVEQLDARTGKLKHRVDAEGEIKDADGINTSVCFVDENGLHSLNGGSGRKGAFKDATGVSVSEKAVCVTSGTEETEGFVTYLNADGATEKWSQSIKDKHPVVPIQDGARVFVPASNSLTAFDASNGSLLWTTEDESLSRDEIVPTRFGVLMYGRPMLELRDPQTGEVLRAWPEIWAVNQMAVHQIAVHGRFAAISTSGDILWLVDLEQER